MLNCSKSLKKIYFVDTLNIYSSVALTGVPAVYVINVAFDKILLDAHVTSDKVWFRSVFSVQPETLCIEPDEEWQH